MKAYNQIIIYLGLAITVALSIYSARPWGDNYAYQSISGYLNLILFEAWLSIPFIILHFLNKKYGNNYILKYIILFSVIVVTVFGGYVYIDAVFIHTSSTSALIFVFLPVYKILFLGVITLICLIINKSHNKSLQPDP